MLLLLLLTCLIIWAALAVLGFLVKSLAWLAVFGLIMFGVNALLGALYVKSR